MPGSAEHRALMIDTHVDIPWPREGHQAGPTRYQFDLPKMRAGNVSAAILVAYTPQVPVTPASHRAARKRALRMIDRIQSLAAEDENSAIALGADDLIRNWEEGRRSIMIGVENAFPLRGRADVHQFHALGARYVGITHNGDNQFAGAAIPVRSQGNAPSPRPGLTSKGRELITEMNRVGLIVDVSHASEATVQDVLTISQGPILASHSGCRALVNHPRNLTDGALRRIAGNGGLVHIPGVDRFLRYAPDKSAAERLHDAQFLHNPAFTETALGDAQWDLFWRGMRSLDRRFGRASIDDLADHVDHAVNAMGIDHVGISSDFDGGGGIDGWESMAETPKVVSALERRGYRGDRLDKILGGNFIRLLRAVEDCANRATG